MCAPHCSCSAILVQFLLCLCKVMPRSKCWDGSARACADVLAPFALTPDWFKYGTKMRGTPWSAPKIVQHRAMWRALQKLHPGLHWSATTMKEILVLIAETNGSPGGPWERKLTDSELQSYCDTMQRRLRTAASHIIQAQCKSPAPSWLAELLDRVPEDAPPPAASAESVDSAVRSLPAPMNFFYGFDFATKRAWRMPAAKDARGKQHKQLSIAIKASVEGDMECPVAQFKADGDWVRITAITNTELTEMQAMSSTPRQAIWIGQSASGKPLRVSRLLGLLHVQASRASSI